MLEEYQPRLIRYAERITACQDLARDVVQYAFMRLCEAVSEGERESISPSSLMKPNASHPRRKGLPTPSKNGAPVVVAAERGREPFSPPAVIDAPDEHERKKLPTPAWLYAVCRNRAIDLLRQQRKTTRLDDVAAELYRSPAPPPDAAAELSESSQVVRRMVRDLPAAQQEALDLWADGLSYREISEVTEKSEVNVRVIVHRAFRALREHALAESICDS